MRRKREGPTGWVVIGVIVGEDNNTDDAHGCQPATGPSVSYRCICITKYEIKRRQTELVTYNRPMANIKATPTFLRKDRFSFVTS